MSKLVLVFLIGVLVGAAIFSPGPEELPGSYQKQ